MYRDYLQQCSSLLLFSSLSRLSNYLQGEYRKTSNFITNSGVTTMRVFTRRVYLLGLVFILLGAINTSVGMRQLRPKLGEHIKKTITLQLDRVMGEVSLSLLNVESALSIAAAVIGATEEDDRIIRFFEQVLVDNSSFLAMYVSDPQNNSLYTNREITWDPSTVDSTSRPWYQEAVREEGLIFTQPYIDAATDRWVTTIAQPIYSPDGILLGVIGIDEALEGLLATLETAKPSENGRVFVVDRNGQALVGEAGELFQILSTTVSEPKGILYTHLGGEEGYLKWETVGDSGIVIALFAPLTDFVDYGMLIAQVFGTMLASFAVLGFVLIAFQRRYITQPMRQFDQDIMAISLERDASYRLPHRKNSPFEHLRLVINASLDSMQEYLELIAQQQEELTAAYGQLVAGEGQLQEQYEAIREDEERIQHLADHDVLTGLANRRKFEADLEEYLETGQTGAVLLFDLDNFKSINDTLGHVYGDTVLCYLAQLLERSLVPQATAYRFGGDEFLVILDDVVETTTLRGMIDRLLQALRHVPAIEGRKNRITACVGAVRYPHDGTSIEQLLSKADIALYKAKQQGRGRYVLFEPSMYGDFAEQVQIQFLLREAVKTNGFHLVYQPVVDAVYGEITYLEALIRLQGHVLSPSVFIAVAEESDLIQPIGRWVIKEVVRQLAAWQAKGLVVKPISLNLSPKQFYDGGLIEYLKRQLERSHIAPNLIQLEITETVLIDSALEAERVIETFRNLGIKVALDDFGTGYLSLKYLSQMPVDCIKLDRSMIQGLPETLPVIEGLISIAHGLGLQVVAEGIENVEEARQMRKVGCDYLQGYLFSKPCGADCVERMLEGSFRVPKLDGSDLMSIRAVKRIVKGQAAVDGAGVKLVRVFGRDDTSDFDPFLMLDAFDSTNPEDYIKGFPWHPHRGIETVTYLIQGEIEHGDSLGNRGTIYDGECQWMTAGSGIIHQEMPQPKDQILGCQLWLNLPREAKMTEPAYGDIKAEDVPCVEEDGAKIRVVAGQYLDTVGAFQGRYVPAQYFDVEVEANQEWSVKTDAEETLFIYIFRGQGQFDPTGNQWIEQKQVVLFELGETFWVKAGPEGIRFVLLAAKPLGEPIAWGGPIVMNTREELQLAFEEFRNNTFIK